MSDKRYHYNIFDDGTEYIEDYLENKHYFNLNDVEELLNEQQTIIEQSTQKIKNKNKYQQVLEAKIRRLKERIKVLEK